MGNTAIITVSLIGVLLIGAPALAAPAIFRSNAVGMRLDEIAASERARYEYVLELIEAEDREIERLLQNGSEIRRTETAKNGATIWEYEEDSLRSVTTLDNQQRVIREQLYADDGQLIENRRYSRGNRAELTISVYDEEGEFLYQETQRFTVDGRIREARRVYREDQEQFAIAPASIASPADDDAADSADATNDADAADSADATDDANATDSADAADDANATDSADAADAQTRPIAQTRPMTRTRR